MKFSSSQITLSNMNNWSLLEPPLISKLFKQIQTGVERKSTTHSASSLSTDTAHDSCQVHKANIVVLANKIHH